MTRLSKTSAAAITLAIVFGGSTRASGQTLNDVLSFLLTNRSIATDEFVRDAQAAKAAGDALSTSLLIDLSTLPTSTSASGFTYRFDPTIGTSIRSSDAFDPFFTERALTAGAGLMTFGLSYQQSSFQTIDGRSLGDGTLVSTASRLHGEDQFFDVETLTLRVHTDTAMLVGDAGVTDRLDIGAAMPLVRITLSGQRLDNYRGQQTLQASATATTSGPGDLILHTKYDLLRGSTGFAIGAEVRLPTGDARNLLGTGRTSGGPRLIASLGDARTSVHANVGYAVGGFTQDLNYRGAVTRAATERLTLVGEILGDRLASIGRLTESVAPNPSLINVDTIRLTSTDQPTNRLVAVAGVKWNFRATWLITANVVRPLTDNGLNALWTPTITINHSFGQ